MDAAAQVIVLVWFMKFKMMYVAAPQAEAHEDRQLIFYAWMGEVGGLVGSGVALHSFVQRHTLGIRSHLQIFMQWLALGDAEGEMPWHVKCVIGRNCVHVAVYAKTYKLAAQ